MDIECALSSPVVIERSRPAPLVEDGAAHAPASKVIIDRAALLEGPLNPTAPQSITLGEDQITLFLINTPLLFIIK